MSQQDDEDEDRKAILARKAMFIASAMSGIALLDGCSRPQPCLSVVPIERPAPDASAPEASVVMAPEAGAPEPMACLSVLPLDLDGAVDYTPDAALTQPMPCLSMPAPCLSPRPPPRDAGARGDAGRPPRPPRPPEPVPQPCLTPVVTPQPCLSIAVPRVMPNKPDEDE